MTDLDTGVRNTTEVDVSSALQKANARLPKWSHHVSGSITEVRPEQSRKHSCLIVSNESGKLREASPLQPANASAPTLTSDAGNVIEVSPEQLWNACCSIVCSAFGSASDLRLMQFWKAERLRLTSESGSVIEVSPVQLRIQIQIQNVP